MSLRHYINIVESSYRKLYHGSRGEIPIGELLSSDSIEHDDEESQAVEEILEYFRPEGVLPRAGCVFMVDKNDIDYIEKIGGYADYIYEVEPQGQVFKYDVSWWADIYSYAFDWVDGSEEEHEEILRECKSLADNYWGGKQSSNPKWEYITNTAVVVGYVGGYRFQIK